MTNKLPSCETCLFYRQHTPKAINQEAGIVFHGIGRCHKSHPNYGCWPSVQGNDFCGEHSSFHAWLALAVTPCA